MKSLRIFLTLLFAAIMGVPVSARHDHSSMGSSSGMNMDILPVKAATCKTWGKCEMCKSRLEKIAMANGATTADLNIKTKFLTVNSDPSRTSLEFISEKLAKAGHDTESTELKIKLIMLCQIVVNMKESGNYT